MSHHAEGPSNQIEAGLRSEANVVDGFVTSTCPSITDQNSTENQKETRGDTRRWDRRGAESDRSFHLGLKDVFDLWTSLRLTHTHTHTLMDG